MIYKKIKNKELYYIALQRISTKHDMKATMYNLKKIWWPIESTVRKYMRSWYISVNHLYRLMEVWEIDRVDDYIEIAEYYEKKWGQYIKWYPMGLKNLTN